MNTKIDSNGQVTGVLNVKQAIINGNVSSDGKLSGNVYLPRTKMVNDYEELNNKPKIESVVLSGNKTFDDLGMSSITIEELLEILV